MHINVRDILAEEIGFHRAFFFEGETPQMEDVDLANAISGEVKITRTDQGLAAKGQFETEIKLECHRCMRTFVQPVKRHFHQGYSEHPVDDELPIEGSEIDLAPLLRQEILVGLPIKILCSPDCDGVAEDFNRS